MMLLLMMLMIMMTEEAINTNLAKNDAIFYAISHGIISIDTTFA
jgi:hypothetical protein